MKSKMKYQQEDKMDLGQFECTSGVFIVSDPCYELGLWCMGELKDVKTGKWNAFIKKRKERHGTSCSELIVLHDSLSEEELAYLEHKQKWRHAKFSIGVDSGQAGIFDKSAYRNDAFVKKEPDFNPMGKNDSGGRWYAACCDITLSANQAGVLQGGAVSTSGYGDGFYDCYVAKKDKEIIGVKIVFL